jgi:thymidylate synthase
VVPLTVRPHPTLGQAWRDHVLRLLTYGAPVVVRGVPTLELLGADLTFDSVRRRVLVDPTRRLNYRFMATEALWILAGRSDVGSLVRVNSRMAAFSDDGVRLAGAYGPRLGDQLPYVFRTLRDDPTSRQAVATIWTPSPGPSKDVPCTVALQFVIRDGALHTIVTMRSSDAWLGIPYDAFAFATIADLLATGLGVTPGPLRFLLGSAHLYERDADLARRVVAERNTLDLAFPMTECGQNTLHVVSAVHDALDGRDIEFRDFLREPWTTMVDMSTASSSAAALSLLTERL